MIQRMFLCAAVLLSGCVAFGGPSSGQIHSVDSDTLDSDRDGLSDGVEQGLLQRFLPTFMISRADCSVRPAQFALHAKKPTVIADNGTIYGQAFPRKDYPGQAELHYYHLWRKDCGEIGHSLDAEHVSTVIQLGKELSDSKALYWYAAAHEDTLCDASQLTRAATLHAESHGATVWISQGKHASFLSEVLCTRGCGGDRCEQMQELKVRQIVNLGEAGRPMNGIAWLASPEWPLAGKLQRSDFSETRVAHLERLPETDIAWANPAKRPPQAAILGANAALGGAATGARATDTALVVTRANTSSAIEKAAGKTGGALRSSYRGVRHALSSTARKTSAVHNSKPDQ